MARFVINTLDFDTYMSYIQATGADPYVVINYDSANSVWGPKDWTYTQLLALAKSWVSYIKRKGYKVRPSGPLCLSRLPLESVQLPCWSEGAHLCCSSCHPSTAY